MAIWNGEFLQGCGKSYKTLRRNKALFCMKQSYKIANLKFELPKERKSFWSFGGTTTKGTEFLYAVKDENFRSLNNWTIAVRVPKSVYGKIVVVPVQTPAKKVWTALERRSVVLIRANKEGYKRYVYCKVFLADPSKKRNRVGARRGERSKLPRWFQQFGWRIRLKQTVTTTRGRDSRAQVVFLSRDNHRMMIKLYFALKVWVLEEDFNLNRN
jgi:hypothetical protein